MTVEFTVPGTPVGKGRPRFASRGKYVQTYTPEKTRNYEAWVKQCWADSGNQKLSGEIWVFITALFSVPKSASKKARAEMLEVKVWYGKRPDIDNIAKCVTDPLTGLAYDDDNQITLLHVEKVYSEEPCVRIRLVEREAKTCEA